MATKKSTPTVEDKMDRFLDAMEKLVVALEKRTAVESALVEKVTPLLMRAIESTLCDVHEAPPAVVSVWLTGGNRNNQIQLIKAVREITNLGLRESKELSDDVFAGKERMIADSATVDAAERARVMLCTAGGFVSIRPMKRPGI